MTLRTVTYDDSTHKIVPLEPTEEMIVAKLRSAGIEGNVVNRKNGMLTFANIKQW